MNITEKIGLLLLIVSFFTFEYIDSLAAVEFVIGTIMFVYGDKI